MRGASLIVCVLSVSLVVVTAGCATTQAKKGCDQIAEFQASRAPTDPVKSSLAGTCPSVAVAFDPLAVSASTLYRNTVDRVDSQAVLNSNRRTYVGFMNDVKALTEGGKSAGEARAEIEARLDEGQKKAVEDYENELAKKDVAAVLLQLQDDLLKIADATARANAFNAVARQDPSFAALTGMSMLQANKDLMGDLNSVGRQLKDASKGTYLLIQLCNEDKAAQKFMKDYPVP